MKTAKASEMFVSVEGEGGVMSDHYCMIIHRATAKQVPCRRAGYYVDCRNCNIPVLYEDVAKRIIAERL